MTKTLELTKVQKLAVKDQQEKIKLCVADLHEKGVAVLSGGAGFGKTYCARKIVEAIVNSSDKIIITTLSHKALSVASDFMKGTQYDFETYTNAAATHAVKKVDPDGTEFFEPKERYKYVKGKKIIIPPPISKADFIVWDECSQASHETIELVNKLKKTNCKILYVGDIAQLPPVGYDSLSPVFTEFEVHELKYPFRYEGENAEVANFMRSNILRGLNNQDYNPYCWKELIGLNYTDFKMLNGNDSEHRRVFNDQMISHFKKDELFTKYIAYHNWNYKKVASYIRNQLHSRRYDWENEDVIMSKSNYYDAKGIMKLQNSQEGTITGKRKMTLACIWVKEHNGYRFLTLHPEKYQSVSKLKSYYSQTFRIKADQIFIEEVDYWSHDIDESKFIPTKPMKANWVKDTVAKIFANGVHPASPCNHKGEAKSMVTDFFCDIQYAYALTSHTAQGSTYNYVFSSLKDIYANPHTSELEKLQAAYVAMTRARFKNFVLY